MCKALYMIRTLILFTHSCGDEVLSFQCLRCGGVALLDQAYRGVYWPHGRHHLHVHPVHSLPAALETPQGFQPHHLREELPRHRQDHWWDQIHCSHSYQWPARVSRDVPFTCPGPHSRSHSRRRCGCDSCVIDRLISLSGCEAVVYLPLQMTDGWEVKRSITLAFKLQQTQGCWSTELMWKGEEKEAIPKQTG